MCSGNRVVSYITYLSLSNARLTLLSLIKRTESERKRGRENKKKGEREKYKNRGNNKKKKTSIFSGTLRITIPTCNFFTLDPIPFCLHIPQIHPRSSVASLDASANRFISFLTPYFSFFFPLRLFKYSKSCFSLLSSLYLSAFLFRFERWFHVLRIRSRSFCPGERAEYFDEPQIFQGKSFSTNWLGKILKKKKKREGKFDPFDALVKASSLYFRFNSLFHPV